MEEFECDGGGGPFVEFWVLVKGLGRKSQSSPNGEDHVGDDDGDGDLAFEAGIGKRRPGGDGDAAVVDLWWHIDVLSVLCGHYVWFNSWSHVAGAYGLGGFTEKWHSSREETSRYSCF